MSSGADTKVDYAQIDPEGWRQAAMAAVALPVDAKLKSVFVTAGDAAVTWVADQLAPTIEDLHSRILHKDPCPLCAGNHPLQQLIKAVAAIRG